MIQLLPAGLAALLFVLPPLAAHFGMVAPFSAFLVWIGSMVPGAIAFLIGLRLLVKGQPLYGLLSLGLGLTPLGWIGSGLWAARALPPINDIATNLESPPAFSVANQAPENAGNDMAYPDAFRETVRAKYPDLISLQIPKSAPEVFVLVERTARAKSTWRLTRVDRDAMEIEGEDQAGFFKFTDDFVIRILPMDSSAQVDMRSRSRVGEADFGANAARIRQFFAELEAQASGATP